MQGLLKMNPAFLIIAGIRLKRCFTEQMYVWNMVRMGLDKHVLKLHM